MGAMQYFSGALAGAFVLLLAGCDSDDGPRVVEPTATRTAQTTPPLTAPPTQSPEEEARERIAATVRELVGDLDHYLANASDYAKDDQAWSSGLVKQWPVRDDAQAEFENLVVAWANAEVEQVGDTTIADQSIASVGVDEDGEPIDATSTACLDLNDTETVDYSGEPADVPTQQYQTWDMTWYNLTPEPGWVIVAIAISDEPC